ncbi:MAG: Nramp family divalent metal transporter [Chloroflexota bacterium]
MPRSRQGDGRDPPPAVLESPSTSPATTGSRRWLHYVKAIGPGMMAGLADNDPAGVASYAIAGAVAGYSQLWLIVLATFMVQAVQVSSARLGDVTQQGVLHLARARYGWKVGAVVAIAGLLANEATLIADVAALGASLELLTGLPWTWFVVPASIILLLVTVLCSYRGLRNVFLVIGLLLLSYVVTAFLVHPDWGAALRHTVIPTVPSQLVEIEAAVALLGTTVSPYLLFWEAEGEREAHRTRRQFRFAEVDVTVGYVASNVVSYFIVVTTAATLFVTHQQIRTAADAAMALRPLAGDLAEAVFAVGLLGAGLLAVPMFAVSSGYIATGMLGWQSGLSKTPAEAPGFYAILSVAFLSGGLAAVIGVDPFLMLLYSQILDTFLMPILIVVLFLLVNDRQVMGNERHSRYYNGWLVASCLVMTAGAILLVTHLI